MNILAVDIGGTHTKMCLCDERGSIRQFQEYATESHLGGDHVMERLMLYLGEYGNYDAIAISTAGQVDADEGVIIYANDNIPGYTGMRIRDRITSKFGKPVKVENDVNAAALGEAYFGAGKPYRHFLCLTYGTGIGGAIVIDRKLFRGDFGSAGEFGHMITHSPKEWGLEGKASYYETYASTSALVRKARRVDPDCVNGRALFEKLSDENDALWAVVLEWIDEVAIGLASLIHIFNPAAIIVGGGVMERDELIPIIEQRTKQLVMASYRKVSICRAALGNKAGLLGAASLFFR